MEYKVKVKAREVADDNFEEEGDTYYEPDITGGYGCRIVSYTPALQRCTVIYDVDEDEYELIKAQDGFIEDVED